MIKTVQKNKGFTLVELLVVIAIVAILAAVVVLIINPLELTRRGRDAARLTDLSNSGNWRYCRIIRKWVLAMPCCNVSKNLPGQKEG